MTEPSFQLGQVVECDDPQLAGRVRLILPDLLGEAVMHWVPVLIAYGTGSDRQPRPGDKVLVALPEGDVTQAVVLGKLPD